MTARANHSVVELRQYTVQAGFRDHYVDQFDRHLVDPQEEVGIGVLAQFRDLDDPDRFVWLRGFENMVDRYRALTEFYDQSEAWQAHAQWASDLVVDWNALLLRPIRPFPAPATHRSAIGADEASTSCVLATICHLHAPVDDDLVSFFTTCVLPELIETGANPIGCFRTEYAKDLFIQMPVLTGVHILTWFSVFPDKAQCDKHSARLARSATWNDVVLPELSKRLNGPARQLRLSPTARSLLR
jgi:hypothetical protein